jgi:Fe2+ or Zn2+ uptake regulation protein
MTSYGSTVPCPFCNAVHAIRMGEIGDQRQVEFTCDKCGEAVSINQPAEEPVAQVQAENAMGFKLKTVD